MKSIHPMIWWILLLLILPIAWGLALAQPRPGVEQAPLPSSPQTAPERPGQIVISREDCRRVLRFAAGGDVAYKPGVDVQGRPVAPADLPGSAIYALPSEITIDLQRPLRSVAPHLPPQRVGGSDVNLGRIAVDPLSGNLRINGEPLGDPVLGLVLEACRRAGIS